MRMRQTVAVIFLDDMLHLLRPLNALNRLLMLAGVDFIGTKLEVSVLSEVENIVQY